MNSKALAFLAQLENAQKDISVAEFQLGLLEKNRSFVKAARSDRSPVMVAFGHANYEKCCDRIVDLEREIDKLRTHLLELRSCVIGAIERIPSPVHARLIQLHYIDKLPLTKIAELLGYSRTHIYRVHAAALDMLADVIE